MRKVKKPKKPVPIALFCSDIHLSDEVPSARAETAEEWRTVQYNYLQQMIEIAVKNDVPIFIAGDIFHTPEVSLKLLNGVMLNFTNAPTIYAVAGNHDLPHHNYNNIYNSAYGSLVISDKIINIGIHETIEIHFRRKRLKAWGFPYGTDLIGIEKDPDICNIALAHKFCWFGKNGHKQADERNRADQLAKQLEGFDVAVFGDNHIGFLHERDIDVFNCGCMIPRRLPEQLLTPQVGLLYSDNRIKAIPLDNSRDKWKDKIELPENPATSSLDVYSIFEGMENLPAESKVDFAERVFELIEQNDIREEVKSIVLNTLNNVKRELV